MEDYENEVELGTDTKVVYEPGTVTAAAAFQWPADEFSEPQFG